MTGKQGMTCTGKYLNFHNVFNETMGVGYADHKENKLLEIDCPRDSQ